MLKIEFIKGYYLFIVLFCGCVDNPHSSVLGQEIYPEKTRIPVGNSPGSVESADFNKDGFPDLVVSSETDSTVTILINDQKGAFIEAEHSPFYAGPNPNDIAINDLDKDGNMDLAIANHENKFLTILLGKGNGDFSPAECSPFAVRGIPHTHGIAAGDFNKDGRIDLVTDSWGNDQVEVIYGGSPGLFKAQTSFFKVGRRPYQRIRAGDINRDGIDDIVTTNTESNNASILLGNTSGNMEDSKGSPFPCGDNPFGVAIGDINGDGLPDLAIINSPASMAEGKGINGLTLLLGDGKGSFNMMKGSPFYAGKIPNRLAIGDVNADGVNDIVSSDNDDNKVYLFLMNKEGRPPGQSTITVGNHPKGIVIADIEKNGRPAIIVCNQKDNDLSIVRVR